MSTDDGGSELEKELASVGLAIPRAQVIALTRLATATEFEKALLAGQWVGSRSQAHKILQLLKRRARVNRIDGSESRTLTRAVPCG